MVHESSSHGFYLHMFHMIYDLECIFTVDIIDIMISMINISLYVIIMLLNYGIKMTWKLPIILTDPNSEYNKLVKHNALNEIYASMVSDRPS